MTSVATVAAGSRGGTQDVFYGRHELVPLPLMERASGVRMWDVDGNEYIDASSGPMVSALGHGNQAVVQAMADQASTLDYAFTRVARNLPNLEYANRLTTLAGAGFERVFLTSGGSEAIEAAVAFLRQYAVVAGEPSRTRVITLVPSYHGGTVFSASMSGNETLAGLGEGIVVDTVPAPLSYRIPEGQSVESYATQCATALEAKILELGPENVLAFMIEPIGGLSTGAVVPPEAYFRAIRETCSRHGVFLMFDEILCGAGRSGRFVAAHHWPGALPDVVVKAKGLGAGYSPLGAVLVSERLVDVVADAGGFGLSYSYNANPISCAVGLAVLNEFDRLSLVERANSVGAELRRGLEDIEDESPIVGDVRGMGMLLAVEMVADKDTKTPFPPTARVTERIRLHGLRRGVMLYSRQTSGGRFGHWFMVAPPLTITAEDLAELLIRARGAVTDLAAELHADGFLGRYP